MIVLNDFQKLVSLASECKNLIFKRNAKKNEKRIECGTEVEPKERKKA